VRALVCMEKRVNNRFEEKKEREKERERRERERIKHIIHSYFL